MTEHTVLLLLGAAGPLGWVAGGEGVEADLVASAAVGVASGGADDGAGGVGAGVEDELHMC